MYEIYFFLDGEADFVVEGNIHSLKPGTLMLCGRGATHHIHIKNSYEYDVERHVEYTGNGQKDQRTFGIAGSAEDRRAEVVDHSKGDAAEVYFHIQCGKRQHICGGIHPAQERLGECDAYHCQHHTADQGGGNSGMDGLVDHRVLLSADTVGYCDTGTYGQTDE